MAQFPNTTPTTQAQAQALLGNFATTAGLPNSNGFDLITYLCAIVGNMIVGVPGTQADLSTSPLTGVGYAAGAGSSVVQGVAKTSAITLNNVTGLITFANSALAAYVTSSCTWTNSAIGANDVLTYSVVSGAADPGRYIVNWSPRAGSATLWISNPSSAALTEAPVIQYAIVKGAQS